VTAVEIRAYVDDHLAKGTIPDTLANLRMLSEIAAQLAELNAKATNKDIEDLRKELRKEIAKWRPQGEKSI
jgi:hypothetical protein